MAARTKSGNKLSLPQKFSRLRLRLHDPQWRKYGSTVFLGKMMGLGLVLLLMVVAAGFFFTTFTRRLPLPRLKAQMWSIR